METAGHDGSDAASYESVASEGGYEPASDRGRDPLPRIIYSSHCVDVFRRLRYVDGAYCCRDTSPADDGTLTGRAGRKADKAALANKSAGSGQVDLRPHDPLAGLPARLLRFEGAMEAWLEEVPPHGDGLRKPKLYRELNDAADHRPDLTVLKAGNRRATLWYFTLDFLQQLWPFFLNPDGSGLKLWERALIDRACTITSTHSELGQVHGPPKGKSRTQWLKAVFSALQASQWCPDGEARQLLSEKRMTHASMSIGDAIQIGSELYVAGLGGFVSIKEARLLLPPTFEADEEKLSPSSRKDEESEVSFVEESEEEYEVSESAENGVAYAAEEAAPSGAAGDGKSRKKRNRGWQSRGARAVGDGEPTGAKANAKGGKGRAMFGRDAGNGKPKGGKGGKGGGGDVGKGGAGGKGRKSGAGIVSENGGESRWVPKQGQNGVGVAGGARADRRALRAQLQAQRQSLQPS